MYQSGETLKIIQQLVFVNTASDGLRLSSKDIVNEFFTHGSFCLVFQFLKQKNFPFFSYFADFK